MLSTRAVVLFALIAISSTACAGSKATDEDMRDARTAIEAANAKFSEAFARGDAKALSALFAGVTAILAKKVFKVTSSAAGLITVTWTDTATEAVYLAIVLPNGKRSVSAIVQNAS